MILLTSSAFDPDEAYERDGARARIVHGHAVDVAQVSFIAPIIVDTALGAIDRHIGEFKVLVHCNQGLSRSPSIALLYLLKHTDALGSQDPAAALLAFRRLYPPYAPAQGMADYVRLNWAKYLQDG